jgi:hypothetical protein
MRRVLPVSLALVALFSLISCERQGKSSNFAVVRVDKSISTPTSYPLAVDPNRVGTYSAETKSGGGYFYDDVLEYRVWLHPEKGAEPLNGSRDYFVAFAEYEPAVAFSKANRGAEEPIVLVRQLEWINEPEPGHYFPMKGERITEWQTPWLAGSKRAPGSIGDFIKHPKPATP